MGAPLTPQPAVGCKTAAGEWFGNSSAVGIAATALHWPPATVSRAQLQTVGSALTMQAMHWGFSYPACPEEWKFYSFLGAVYLRPKRNLWEGSQAPALGHQLEITNGEWDVGELTARRGSAELLKQHMPPSAPLLSACGLYTLQVFNSRSFSFTFLGDFLSNAVYVYFLFPSQCPPTPMQYFSCSNLLSSRKDINPILLNPAS